MLTLAEITPLARQISSALPYVNEIKNAKEHRKALDLMDDLIEDYDGNLIVIEALSNAITRYEEQADEFADFNRAIGSQDGGIATLKVLMDQHQLNTSDFEQEIGKKSMVSLILNGKRQLSRKHIAKLAQRFSISPSLFF